MDDATVTTRALRQATLTRQQLIEPADAEIVDLVRNTGPPQAQYCPSPHLALRARSTRPLATVCTELDTALIDRRLVKATLLRGTLHLLAAEDYADVRAALDWPLRRLFRRHAGWEPTNEDVDGLRTALAEAADAPRRRDEIAGRLSGRAARLLPDAAAVSLATRFVVPTVHAPESGTWHAPRQVRLVSADVWLGDPTNRGWLAGDAEAGRRWLVRTHLAAYGPATIHDIAAWSGLGIRELRGTVTALDEQLVTRRGPDDTPLVDLADAPANATNGHIPVALLPWWDAVLLAYRDRTRLLGDLDRQAVQERDYIRPTVLLDGRVVATWHYTTTDDRATLEIQPVAILTNRGRERIHAAATHLLTELAPALPADVTGI